MDAAELLAGDDAFILDTSAWWRTTAAAAAEHGGLAVLHRDVHFDRLAEVLAFTSVTLPVP